LAHLNYNNFAANTAAALIGFALIYLWMVITAHQLATVGIFLLKRCGLF